MTTQLEQYHVAVFTPDGAFTGQGTWKLADLSERWLEVCDSLLKEMGPSFRTALPGGLGHLELKVTCADGTGLGTFYAREQVVLSTVYLSGANPQSEAEVVTLFVESLRRTHLVRQLSEAASPFFEIEKLHDRPLHVVVVWGNPDVNEQDQELVREFSNHFAGAFLRQLSGRPTRG